MECPYLEVNGEGSVCNASTRQMKPHISDMIRYCVREEYDRCPIFLAHILRRGASKRLFWAEVA